MFRVCWHPRPYLEAFHRISCCSHSGLTYGQQTFKLGSYRLESTCANRPAFKVDVDTVAVQQRHGVPVQKIPARTLERRRIENLRIHGVNNAKNDQAVNEILSILQECGDIEVVKLPENCHVRLIVRRPGSDLWLGLAVRATTTKTGNGCYFIDCRKSPNVLNICTALPPLWKLTRWWLVPGEHVVPIKTGFSITPGGKWANFEVHRAKFGACILEQLGFRLAHLLPLSEWAVPKSHLHQKENELFFQLSQKVLTPAGCNVKDALMSRTPVDTIIDDISVQIKTAYVVKGCRGLRFPIFKHGGRKENSRPSTQPYSIDDGIDAIFVNVVQGSTLTGLFIFPIDEIIIHGWFRGHGHKGQTCADLYLPHLTPKKSREWVKEWQLRYFLDLSNEVDLDRAQMLLRRCKPID